MQTTTYDEIEDKAKSLLPKGTYDYIAGGAGREKGLKNNLNVLSDYQIIPRVLQGIKEVDTSVEIFGQRYPSPVIIGPAAFHKLVHKRGEIETANAATDVNTIFTLSTISSCSIEEVAAASSGSKWFQLYCYKNKSLTENLIHRAKKCGYKALIVTVDAPLLGDRLRDKKNQFKLPPDIDAANFRETAKSSLSDKTNGSKIKEYTDQEFDPSLSWENIEWLKSITDLPIIIKGVQHPQDAILALKHDVDGIVVSNHGGRQVDSVISPIESLKIIAPIINSRIPLFVDGGFRSGEDVFKAIAFGADAVLIARPVLWSLAVDGKDGVSYLLQEYKEQLKLTMFLSGCNTLDKIHEFGQTLLFNSRTNSFCSAISYEKLALEKDFERESALSR